MSFQSCSADWLDVFRAAAVARFHSSDHPLCGASSLEHTVGRLAVPAALRPHHRGLARRVPGHRGQHPVVARAGEPRRRAERLPAAHPADGADHRLRFDRAAVFHGMVALDEAPVVRRGARCRRRAALHARLPHRDGPDHARECDADRPA
ncbi:hypothetical protein VARIO8X_60531 [Burkholderiales bacterium 8X]|nr:hypothetical protein VARIO8X_60531 [Burkholderiales bacterium 8X]